MLSSARLALVVTIAFAASSADPLSAQEGQAPEDALRECERLTLENARDIASHQGREPVVNVSLVDSEATPLRRPLAAPELIGSCREPEMLRSFAMMLLDHQDVADAVTAAEAAVRLDPAEVQNHLVYAGALHRSNRLEDALAAYAEATRVTADTSVLPSLLAAQVEVLSSLGRWNDALPGIRRYIRFRPDDASMRLRLGDALLQLDRTEEAMRSFRDAIRLEPHEASHWALLALTATKLGRHRDAVSYWERALSLDLAFFDGEHAMRSMWEASLRSAGPQPAATLESLLASARP